MEKMRIKETIQKQRGEKCLWQYKKEKRKTFILLICNLLERRWEMKDKIKNKEGRPTMS